MIEKFRIELLNFGADRLHHCRICLLRPSCFWLIALIVVLIMLREKKVWAHRKNSSIRSDEGLTLETSAFESLYGGQFTLSTQLTKPNYLVILPPTQHHSFFRNLPLDTFLRLFHKLRRKIHRYQFFFFGTRDPNRICVLCKKLGWRQ